MEPQAAFFALVTLLMEVTARLVSLLLVAFSWSRFAVPWASSISPSVSLAKSSPLPRNCRPWFHRFRQLAYPVLLHTKGDGGRTSEGPSQTRVVTVDCRVNEARALEL